MPEGPEVRIDVSWLRRFINYKILSIEWDTQSRYRDRMMKMAGLGDEAMAVVITRRLCR